MLRRLFEKAGEVASWYKVPATVMVAWRLEDGELHTSTRHLNYPGASAGAWRQEKEAEKQLEEQMKVAEKATWFWLVILSEDEECRADIREMMWAELIEEALELASDEAVGMGRSGTSAIALVVVSSPLYIKMRPYPLGLPVKKRQQDRWLGKCFRMYGTFIKKYGVPEFQVFVAGGYHAEELARQIRETLGIA